MARIASAPVPAWLRALGAAVIALLVGALGYAVAIGIVNFPRIGV
jgi:hypothetical protein